jgi:hypothetical protein
MKSIFYITLFSLTLIACKKQNAPTTMDAQVVTPNVKLSFELTANGLPFKLDSSFVTNQNYPLEINKFRFYISNVTLVNAADTVAITTIKLVDFEDEFVFNFSVENGSYNGLILNFGVPDSLNLGDPTTYENESPLGIYGSNGMHWTWLTGYRFLAIDGYAANNVTEPENIGVSLHSGTANLYQKKQLAIDGFVVNDNLNELVIQIALEDIFSINQTDTLDVRTENQSHTFGPTAVKVTNRFLNSWKIKP